VDWIGLAKDRNRWKALVESVLNLRVAWNAGKLWSGLISSGLLSSVQLHRVSFTDYIVWDMELVKRRNDTRSEVSLKNSGCAIVRAINRRLPGVESGSGHTGFVVDKVELGQVFS
jgi:hypothetical protein